MSSKVEEKGSRLKQVAAIVFVLSVLAMVGAFTFLLANENPAIAVIVVSIIFAFISFQLLDI